MAAASPPLNALARDGGLDSTFWAEPETLSRRMRNGEVPMQGGPRFVDDDCATLIGGQLGLF
jgi:hypothetical protein